MTGIDLDSGRSSFEGSTDFTIGIEEEFQILDPETLDLADRFEQLYDAAQAEPKLGESVAGELIASEIEIRSGRGEDIHDALDRQRELRRLLFELAQSEGVLLGATGTHPWASYLDQKIIDTEHYRRVQDGLQWVARRNNTFSVHVHVGVRGADRAVRVCDRLRPLLPELLAVSASSPFLDGRDTGLHSVRTETFTRTFPRCGVPDAFGDWSTFAEYVDFLIRSRSIVEYTQVWWSVRPHLSFGTVEVRICDAQATALESEALIGLITACVAQAAAEVDAGATPPDLPPRVIEENLWRAIRHGLDGELLDLRTGDAYPARVAIERLLDWTADARAQLGIEVTLPAANGSQRQRALLADGLDLRDVFAATVAETRRTYSEGVASTAEASE